jgi:hypothetical protein
MRLPDDRAYYAKLAATRQADAKHEAEMQIIARAAGLSLEELRRQPDEVKEALILRHRHAIGGAE